MNEKQSWERWDLEGGSPEAYEQYLVPGLFAPWAEQLVELAAPAPGERVLDVACGTGIVARYAAPHVGQSGTVVGLDANPAMLAVARTAAADLRPAIEWREGSAEAVPFEDDAFDLVFCQQALQFFADPALALREMHRVLRADGRLALNVLRAIRHNPAYAVLADALERYAGAQAGAIMRSPFPDWSGERLGQLVSEAGFADVYVRIGIGAMRYPSAEEFLRREAASSPLAGPIGTLSEDVREQLVAELGQALRDYTDSDGIVFPMETHLLVAGR